MTEYLQHQERLKSVLMTVNEAIHELNEARELASRAQMTADPQSQHRYKEKLEQAELRAENARRSLLAEANQSQEQQVLQNLQELENAMANARQF
jgi:Zn-dependent M16 (insulinase) family peptidase